VRAAGLVADTYPAPYIMAWGLFATSRDTPFKDVRVRRAVNHAVDKEGIIKNLLRGHGFAAGQGAARMTFGYNPNVKAYAYDPALARRLLTEAGVGTGFSMAVEVLPGNFPADAEIYQQVAQDLGRVGIAVDLRSTTMADWIRKVTSDPTKFLFEDKVFAYQQDIGLEGEDVTRTYRQYSCRKRPAFYCDPAELQAVEQAEAEFDIEKRRALYQNLMQRFHDNAPALFLTELTDIVARSAKVRGLKLTQRVLSYHEASVD
jgi:ABC-type transport system substrate-binding protein